MNEAELPLAGIRVVELASVWAMPGAAMYLADQGANVIKVEPPEGEIGRTVTITPPVHGRSRAFWSLNRNKRAIVADLKTAGGQRVVGRLAESADVLIQNFRPAAARRLAMDYPSLSQRNPRLVYVSFNAFGTAGPRADARGYDLLVQAASGVSVRRRHPDGSPQPLSIFAVDMASAMLIGYAVMLALFQRERTGRGQEVNGSLLQTALALQLPEAVRVEGHAELPSDATAPVPAVYGSYRCADGEYLQLAIASEAEWRSLCAALGGGIASDARFETGASRLENSNALRSALADRFANAPGREWQERMDRHDAPGVLVERAETIFDSEQVSANAGFATVDQPGIGRTSVVNTPFRLLGAASRQMTPAPDLGQHTDEVLREIGFSASEIEALRSEGSVG